MMVSFRNAELRMDICFPQLIFGESGPPLRDRSHDLSNALIALILRSLVYLRKLLCGRRYQPQIEPTI